MKNPLHFRVGQIIKDEKGNRYKVKEIFPEDSSDIGSAQNLKTSEVEIIRVDSTIKLFGGRMSKLSHDMDELQYQMVNLP